MMDQAVNYKCPACGGDIHFDGATGKLKCDYCDSVYTVEEIEALYAANEERAAQAYEGVGEEAPPELITRAEKEQRAKSRWEESTIDEDWGESTDLRSYVCPSCGGELVCDVATAATQCPFCGNPTVVPGQFKGALKPEYVLPFKLKKEDAVAALKEHYKGRPFLPRSFSAENQIKKLQGIYVPFWLFDCEAAAECWFEGTNSFSHREGDYIVTDTHHYDVRRFGTVRFEHIPADASRKMPDGLMDALEPFPYSELKPFSTAYLPGFLADRYDVSVEECSQRADRRCTSSAGQLMRDDVHGYQAVNTTHSDVFIQRGKVHYALLPVWVLTTKWKDKNYIFAMNGQTGKLAGDLPVDKSRFYKLFLGLSAVLSAAMYFIGIGGWIAGLFL